MLATRTRSRVRKSTSIQTCQRSRDFLCSDDLPNELPQLTTGRDQNGACFRHEINLGAYAQIYFFSIENPRDVYT